MAISTDKIKTVQNKLVSALNQILVDEKVGAVYKEGTLVVRRQPRNASGLEVLFYLESESAASKVSAKKDDNPLHRKYNFESDFILPQYQHKLVYVATEGDNEYGVMYSVFHKKAGSALYVQDVTDDKPRKMSDRVRSLINGESACDCIVGIVPVVGQEAVGLNQELSSDFLFKGTVSKVSVNRGKVVLMLPDYGDKEFDIGNVAVLQLPDVDTNEVDEQEVEDKILEGAEKSMRAKATRTATDEVTDDDDTDSSEDEYVPDDVPPFDIDTDTDEDDSDGEEDTEVNKFESAWKLPEGTAYYVNMADEDDATNHGTVYFIHANKKGEPRIQELDAESDKKIGKMFGNLLKDAVACEFREPVKGDKVLAREEVEEDFLMGEVAAIKKNGKVSVKIGTAKPVSYDAAKLVVLTEVKYGEEKVEPVKKEAKKADKPAAKKPGKKEADNANADAEKAAYLERVVKALKKAGLEVKPNAEYYFGVEDEGEFYGSLYSVYEAKGVRRILDAVSEEDKKLSDSAFKKMGLRKVEIGATIEEGDEFVGYNKKDDEDWLYVGKAESVKKNKVLMTIDSEDYDDVTYAQELCFKLAK